MTKFDKILLWVGVPIMLLILHIEYPNIAKYTITFVLFGWIPCAFVGLFFDEMKLNHLYRWLKKRLSTIKGFSLILYWCLLIISCLIIIVGPATVNLVWWYLSTH